MEFAKKFATVLFILILPFSMGLEGGIFGKNGDTADYIVVGVGTAGATVAKMLTDDLQTSVIALHNGPNLTEDPLIKFSANAAITVPLSQVSSPLFQNGNSTPQVFADNREIIWTVALPEGGASSINAGAFVRGTNQLFAQWEAIAGPNWSVNRILNIFKQLEHYYGKTTNPSARGSRGSISLLQVQNPTAVSQKFTQATINATGFPFVLDYNDPNRPIGVSSQLQYTQSSPDGTFRESSANAFLNTSIMMPNGLGVHGRKLRVFFDSPASKIIWKGNKAIGVEYVNQGQTKKVFANKGVVVCAGLNSSPFLLRSGIGPQAMLQSLNIPVVNNNPNVGQGLVDQTPVRFIFTSNPSDTPLENPGVTGLFSQISFLPDPTGDPTVRALRIAILNPAPGVVIGSLDLCQPLSRGSVLINSSDPTTPPVVNLGVLSNSADLSLLERGFTAYIAPINTAIQAIDPDYELIFPDPAVIAVPVLLTAFIQEEVGCNQHFQSHCRMAPQSQGGVVDSNGRVYGVQNLFVADNSIVPLCTDGAPMASGYLIGANIAQLIIDSNPKSPFSH